MIEVNIYVSFKTTHAEKNPMKSETHSLVKFCSCPDSVCDFILFYFIFRKMSHGKKMRNIFCKGLHHIKAVLKLVTITLFKLHFIKNHFTKKYP